MEAAGLREFNFPAEIALVARAGTPKPVIDKLFAALEIGQKDPAVITILANFLYTLRHATPRLTSSTPKCGAIWKNTAP